MFLIDIRYKKQLHNHSNSREAIFNSIEQVLKHLEVDKVVFANDRLNFRNRSFKAIHMDHLMKGIEKGYFDYNEVTSTVTYNISTLNNFIWSFIGSIIMSFILGLALGSFLMFVFLFLCYFSWLYGLNRIIIASRQRQFFNKLTADFEIYCYPVTSDYIKME